MSAKEDSKQGPEGSDDMLAAEYVLGVLPGAERALLVTRMKREPALEKLVEEWHERLSPLGNEYPETAPPASVKQALDKRLFASTAVTAPARDSLWNNLAFWRAGAIAAFGALAVSLIVPATLVTPPSQPAPGLAAALASDASPVRYLALYEPSGQALRLSHVAGERVSGHDFELWLIEGGNAPVSLGVIPDGKAITITLSAEIVRRLAEGAALAISDEPAGGSKTGAPTGDVLAVGEIRSI